MSRILIALPLVTIILLILLWRHFSRYDVPALPSLLPPNSNDSITIPTADTDTNSLPHFYDPALLSFWEHLSKALDAAAPKCTLPSPLPTATPAKFAEIRKDFAERPDLLNLPSTDVEDLKAAHERYVACLPNLAPKLPYARGSKGIVTTASGAYLPPLLVSLRMLRRTGSVLPVEVWMENQSVYEAQLCEHALPRLNATCKIMDRILSTGSHHVNLTGYQLKSFAMLLSDFDSMLLLDADTIPVALPETMMESEPFMSEGFISWPDYYTTTTSPHYHTLSSSPPPPPSLYASRTSSALLLRKSTHTAPLLLALYYNLHGPTHYYPLLSQGAPAQGDKETYLAAARVLNVTSYSIGTPPRPLGYSTNEPPPQKKQKNKKGQPFRETASILSLPQDDYAMRALKNASILAPAPAFINSAPGYALNAPAIQSTFFSMVNQRMWGEKEEMAGLFGGEGRDVEKWAWSETLWSACTLEGVLRDWEDSRGQCKKVGRIYKFLFG